SLTDLDATVRDALDLRTSGPGGTSLLAMAQGKAEPPSDVLAQYHGGGARSGAFMLRFGDWKYVHYVGCPAQLFHLPDDPGERHNLAQDSRAASALAEGERRLRARLDPEAVDRAAKQAQAALVARHGGRV